jgi:hypothetical protein
MANQFLKLRRSAVPGRIPSTSSLDFGEIALNTYDGLAFIKKSGSAGEEIVTIGSTSNSFTGSFSGSFIGSFTGSLLGTASYAQNANLLDGKDSTIFATTGSNSFNGNQIITGSLTVTGNQNLNGNLSITGSSFNKPATISIASNTASLDFNSSNMFTLTLPNSAINTHITATNLRPGASAALQITQGLAATATVTFSSTFTFPSGSSYTAFASASANDVISLLSFNGSTLRAVGANNFI